MKQGIVFSSIEYDTHDVFMFWYLKQWTNKHTPTHQLLGVSHGDLCQPLSTEFVVELILTCKAIQFDIHLPLSYADHDAFDLQLTMYLTTDWLIIEDSCNLLAWGLQSYLPQSSLLYVYVYTYIYIYVCISMHIGNICSFLLWTY